MSALGLGCVKTQRRCDDVEWAFRQVSFLVVEASCAWSVAIDFGKLFSSSFNFSSSYTARVKLGSEGSETRLPLYPRDQTSPTRPAMSVSCQNRTFKDRSYSNEKIFFQSFFMLITVQFFSFASP
jgi:hypothetical protein